MRKLTYIIIAMTFSLMSFSQVKDLPAGSNFYDFLNGYYSQKDPNAETSKQIERMQIKWVNKLSPSGDCSIAADAITNYAQNTSGTIPTPAILIGQNKKSECRIYKYYVFLNFQFFKL